MHKEFHHDALRRLQALIERETGAPLGEAAQAEMAAILRGSECAGCAATEGLAVAPREVTILLADLRGFTALSGAQPAAVVIAALTGVEVVLCSKIGDCPKDMLTAAGIRATDEWAFDYIETAIGALYAAEFGVEPVSAVA